MKVFQILLAIGLAAWTQAANLYYVSNDPSSLKCSELAQYELSAKSFQEVMAGKLSVAAADLVVIDLCHAKFSHAAPLSPEQADSFKMKLSKVFQSLPNTRNCLVIEPYNREKAYSKIHHPLDSYTSVIREVTLSQPTNFCFTQDLLKPIGKSHAADGSLTAEAHAMVVEAVDATLRGMSQRALSGIKMVQNPVSKLQEKSLYESGYLCNYYVDKKRKYFLTKTQEGVCQYRIPSLLLTKKGTLIAACNARLSTDGDNAHSKTAFRRSTDLGETWSEISMDFPQFHGTQDTALVQDRTTGRIFGLMIHKHEKGKLYLVHSDDDGLTWSTPDNVGRHFRTPEMKLLCPGPGVGLQKKDGTLVYSFYTYYSDKSKGTQCFMITSEDHGKTWTTAGLANDSSTETQITESKDGGLVAISRSNGTKARMKNFWNPATKKWAGSQPDPLLTMTSCQGSLISFVDKKSSKHCTVYSTPTKGRAHGTIYLSFDGGRSWSYSRKINEGYYAYSSMAHLPNGQIGLLYEAHKNKLTGHQTELVYTAFDIDWIIAGDRLK